MKGQKLIKTIDDDFVKDLSKDYQKIMLKKRIKENLFNIGAIGTEVILTAGLFTGAMALAIVAPNVVGAVGRLTKTKKFRPYYFKCEEKKFNRTLSYLKNRHLIELVRENGKNSIKLTKKGERRYHIHLLENMVIVKPKKWDGYWRIVIFDIPEKFKIAREALRQKLHNLGFYQIQKSVLVSPYPCEKEINFIRHLFGLEDYIQIIRADYFQGEKDARIHFELD